MWRHARALVLSGDIICVLLAGCAAPPERAEVPRPATAQPAATALPTPGIALHDALSSPAGSELRVGTTKNGMFTFARGRYVIQATRPNALVWSTFGGSYQDVTVAVDVAFDPKIDTTAAGIMFHNRDDQHFYLFSVSNDGFYALDLHDESGWKSLIEWTRWPEIDTHGGNNRLQVSTQRDSIKLYLNGKLLTETSDTTIPDGRLGLAVNSFEHSAAAVSFGDLRVTPASADNQGANDVRNN